MAGMPKQGYKNLVLAGWVPDPALGLGGGTDTTQGLCPARRWPLGWAGGCWLVALGTPLRPLQGWREREKELEEKKKPKRQEERKSVSHPAPQSYQG